LSPGQAQLQTFLIYWKLADGKELAREKAKKTSKTNFFVDRLELLWVGSTICGLPQQNVGIYPS
jgi:hypothetical protein